jgi:HEAT repeat protein
LDLNTEDLERMRASGDIDGLVKVIQNGEYKLRDVAAEILGECGDERCIDPLINMLREGRFGYIRGAAARALGHLQANKAVPALMETLNDSIYHTRCGAARALGQIGDERAVESLIGTLGDEREYIRWTAADALNRIGSCSVDSLIRFIYENNGRGLDVAITSLAKTGDPRAIEVLLNLAQKHSDEYIRETANKAVELIRNKS